jgi:hypothetical protein
LKDDTTRGLSEYAANVERGDRDARPPRAGGVRYDSRARGSSPKYSTKLR